MPDQREQFYGESTGGFRTKSEGVAVSRSHSVAGVILEEDHQLPDRTADRGGPPSGPEWQLACRVAASKGFCKSEFLPRFLLYVCEQYLTGDTQEITEQRIGTQIFNRSTGYNPGEDNIVRSYARLLRKRLDEYFDGEGRDEPMRIIIPRGGYIPVFSSTSDSQKGVSRADAPADVEKVHAAAKPRAVAVLPIPGYSASAAATPWRPAWLSTLLGMVIGGVLATVVWLGLRSMQAQQDQSAAHAIWAQMFQHNRNTLIVPADSGLGILENLSGHLVTLEEYANGAYPAELHAPPGMDPKNLNDLRRQHYTSVVDLDITSMLTRLPEFIANRTQVRYARGITAEDIKNSNSILLGSAHTNPWVSLFEKRLNFRLEYTPQVDQSFVVNAHPLASEQAIYRNGTDEKPNRTYGTIAYLPEEDGAGHVLIIQGLNMAATQAAADTLFNEKAIQSILQQATLPNGSLKPFELLVETNSVGATAPEAQIIATRFYAQ